MTFGEFADRLRGVQREINLLPEWIEEVVITQQAATALDLFSAVKNRIQQTGIDKDGNKLKGYSTKPILAGAESFRTKSAANNVLGSTAKRKGRNWRTIKSKGKNVRLTVIEGGYKELRELSGLQTGHVDLTFKDKTSGYEGMWSKIKFSVTEKSKGIIVISLEPEQLDAEGNSLVDRVEWLNSHYDTNILEPSKEEIRLAEKDLVKRIIEIINGVIPDFASEG